jgi:hypothetical protein
VSKSESFLTLDGFVGKQSSLVNLFAQPPDFWKYFAEKYVRKLRGETIEQDVAVTSISAETLGTFYFPHASESNEGQNDTVISSFDFKSMIFNLIDSSFAKLLRNVIVINFQV